MTAVLVALSGSSAAAAPPTPTPVPGVAAKGPALARESAPPGPASSSITPGPTLSQSPQRVPGHVIVRFRPGTIAATTQSLTQAEGLVRVRSLGGTGAGLFRTAPGRELETIERLKRSPLVVQAEPDYFVRSTTHLTPSDTFYGSQWDLPKINMADAWHLTLGASTVAVAVLDTGIDGSHPDLDTQWAYASGKSPSEHVFLSNPDPSCSVPPTPDDDPWAAGHVTHGTHVSGTLAAESTIDGDPAVGIAGMAPRVTILPLKVLDCTGSGVMSDVASAIDFARTTGARVINMSLGGNIGSCPSYLQTALDTAYAAGLFIVASAGNDGTTDIASPAGCNYVVGVGTTDSSDTIASFSQHNSSVDVSAPGVSTVSAARCHSASLGCTPGDHVYLTLSGTSMAAPHVAGCAALMFAVNSSLPPSAVESTLKGTAVDLGTPGRDDYYGFGRLNCGAAVNAAAAAAGTGLLRVYSDPAVATTIKINGIARNDWGLDWLELPPGNYTISFGEVTGFAGPTTLSVTRCNPSCGSATDQAVSTAVTVRAGETTVVRAPFTSFGFLRATTLGYGTLSPTVSIDSRPANEWGVWVAEPPGSYTLSFESLAGLVQPCSRTATVSAGATTRVDASYADGSCILVSRAGGATTSGQFVSQVAPGLLRVYSDPAVATTVAIDGVSRNDWGLDWLELAAGDYTLSFHAVTGFSSPTTLKVKRCSPSCGGAADQTVSTAVTVRAGETTEVRAAFTSVGFLRVTTEGYGSYSPTVSIDGNPVNEWGTWVAVPAGTYSVSFESLSGLTRPCTQSVTVAGGATTHVHGNYSTGSCNIV